MSAAGAAFGEASPLPRPLPTPRGPASGMPAAPDCAPAAPGRAALPAVGRPLAAVDRARSGDIRLRVSLGAATPGARTFVGTAPVTGARPRRAGRSVAPTASQTIDNN